MTVTRKQKWLLALLGLLLILAWHPLKWKFFPPGGTPMDTSTWQTYCVGRFLIDLPPDAIVTIQPGEIWGDPIVWRQDLTPETLSEEVEKKIKILQATKHEKLPGSQFIGTFPLPNVGIALHYWKTPYSDATSIMESYYITPEGRVLLQAAEVGRSKFDIGKKLALELAPTLHARDDWDPIPTEPGFCFPGGFSAQTGDWRSERANLHADFPDHPGVGLAFALWGMGIEGKKMFDSHDKLMVASRQATPGVNILRYGDVHLGDIPAQETADVEVNRYGKKYDFTLQSPSKGKRLDRPEIWLAINNVNDFFKPHTDPFNSDAEALGLWDAIKNTIRLRPGAI
jgi:hypothetical protein